MVGVKQQQRKPMSQGKRSTSKTAPKAASLNRLTSLDFATYVFVVALLVGLVALSLLATQEAGGSFA
jgi:hypothetical protein